MKFMKLCQADIKILFALKQYLLYYASNLIYGVRLQEKVLKETLEN